MTVNASGDVSALVSLGYRERIVVWDRSGNRRTLDPPPFGEKGYDGKTASTQDRVVAPNGTFTASQRIRFPARTRGVRTRLYAWRSGDPLRIDGQPCSGYAPDLHPTAVAPDGRVALDGGYDSAVMNFDAINAGGMPPTATLAWRNDRTAFSEGKTQHRLRN